MSMEWNGHSLGNNVKVKVFTETPNKIENLINDWLTKEGGKIKQVVDTNLSSTSPSGIIGASSITVTIFYEPSGN